MQKYIFTLSLSFTTKLLQIISVTMRVIVIINGKEATDSWRLEKIKTGKCVCKHVINFLRNQPTEDWK